MNNNELPEWLKNFRIIVEIESTETLIFDSRVSDMATLDIPYNGGHKTIWGGIDYKDNYIKIFTEKNEWETFLVKGISIERYDYYPESISFDFTIRINV